MQINLLSLESERRFEELCQSLLGEEFQRFQAFSAPDAGMDGYDSDTATIFQVYFPERAPLKEKIRADLKKARAHGETCKRWILLLPKNPTPAMLDWLKNAEQPACTFSIGVWGKNEIFRLLRKHSSVRDQFFPSQLRKELGRLAKGKKPAFGDAEDGKEISAEQGQELRELLTKLAEDDAARKRRKVCSGDFQREYREFNAHFRLSSYDRLPRGNFAVGRAYLESKLYARRDREPRIQTRQRLVRGIKAIQKQLAMRDSNYRDLLFEATGKRSTTDLDIDELSHVFELFRHKQGLAVSRASC
jgi:hypothetical protein